MADACAPSGSTGQEYRPLSLHRRHPGALSAAELALHFQREDWAAGLPPPATIRLRPGRTARTDDELGVFDLEAFKGPEADTVILLAGGYRPMRPEEIYVAVSRARLALIIVNCGADAPLPRGADEILASAKIDRLGPSAGQSTGLRA